MIWWWIMFPLWTTSFILVLVFWMQKCNEYFWRILGVANNCCAFWIRRWISLLREYPMHLDCREILNGRIWSSYLHVCEVSFLPRLARNMINKKLCITWNILASSGNNSIQIPYRKKLQNLSKPGTGERIHFHTDAYFTNTLCNSIHIEITCNESFVLFLHIFAFHKSITITQ